MVKKKEILVAVAGLTPQVITETLYYLTRIKKPPSAISQIYAITTLDGKHEILSKLLDRKKGKFFRFCRDFKINPLSVNFDEDSIILLKDSEGKPLKDIRTAEDNETVANQIMDFIRGHTKDPDVVIHCSIAGGRKTMSVYLAYALMFFGRKGDTLSHVLVDEKSERDKEFFYPKKSVKKNAAVELAEIPYVRLRDKIKNLFGSERLSFSQMVKFAQKEIDAMPSVADLVVNLKKRCLVIGDKEISLRPKHLALYAHYAERRRIHSAKASFESLKGENSINNNLDEIQNYILKMLPNVNLQKYRFKPEHILQDISKINKLIENALDDPALASYYKITPAEPIRMYGATRYGIHLDKSKIKSLILP